jgi:Fibrinogen beta and gamma chains, C-terminal globular domain
MITFTKGFTISNKSTLGTIGNPAKSAVQLYNAGIQTNGWYYIQTGMMTSSVQVYCNQTDNGGGWMMIMYNPSGSTQTGYPYPNDFSGSVNSFNSKLYANTMKLWYNMSGSAQCNSVMRMASTASVQPLLASCSIAHQVTYTNPTALNMATGSGTFTLLNATPLTGSWTPIKGYTIMISSLATQAPPDWLYDGTNWWNVTTPTTDLATAYGRSGNALGNGGWTNRLTNNVYGLANVATGSNSNITNFNTLAVYIK